MSKVKGMLVKVYIKDTTGKLLAGQKNASLKRTAGAIDATSKDTVGGWKESLAGLKEWGIDCDGAFVVNDVAYELLETAYIAGDNVTAYVEFPSGLKYEGTATITDLSLEASMEDLVQSKISLQGSGALTKTETVI